MIWYQLEQLTNQSLMWVICYEMLHSAVSVSIHTSLWHYNPKDNNLTTDSDPEDGGTMFHEIMVSMYNPQSKHQQSSLQ
jgi:hypothetical protein